MRKAIILFIVLMPAICSQSQQSGNILFPSELLIENLCPVSNNFYDGSPWENRYFSMKDSANATLPNILLNGAFNSNNRVYSLVESNFYPYDIEDQQELDSEEIFKALGGETRVLTTNEDEILLRKSIDTTEIQAVEFIEAWKLDTTNFNFTKTVKGFIPIRKYSAMDVDHHMFSRTCVIMQHPPVNISSGRKLVARVKYEVPLVDQNEDITTCLSNNGTNPNELLFRYEMLNNPMLTSYSRYMLIHYIEDKAFQNKINCFDFKTNEPVNNPDTIKKALGYRCNVISFINLDGSITDTQIQEKTGFIKSVVFCEEWYIDTSTGYFSKEVIGMAPVLWNENNQKSINLVLWFNKDRKF